MENQDNTFEQKNSTPVQNAEHTPAVQEEQPAYQEVATDADQESQVRAVRDELASIMMRKEDGGDLGSFSSAEKITVPPPSRRVTGARRFFTAAALGIASLFASKESKATIHTEDSLKNKIESVVKKGDPTKKDSAKTVTLETGKEEAFSDQLRKDWNDYQAWLKSIDMAGNEALDKNDLGGQMIDQYRKEHPNTLVSRETIDDIQQEFAKYRAWVLAEVKAGRAMLTTGTAEKDFMAQLSKVDGIAGQFTTAHRFPDAYLQTFQNGKLVKTENRGFAKTGTTVSYPGAAKDSK